MQKYCEKCGRITDSTIIIKEEEYEVFGEPIKVEAQVLVCKECGEEHFSEELDNATLETVYKEYRRRHGSAKRSISHLSHLSS